MKRNFSRVASKQSVTISYGDTLLRIENALSASDSKLMNVKAPVKTDGMGAGANYEWNGDDEQLHNIDWNKNDCTSFKKDI